MSINEAAPVRRSRMRWLTVALALAIGVAYFVAGWVGGNRAFGVFGLGVMTATAVAFLVLSRYSETVAGLLDRRDERINGIDSRATAVAGMALIVAVIVAFVVEVARGHSGSPYGMLGAIAGLAYLAAVVYYRIRG